MPSPSSSSSTLPPIPPLFTTKKQKILSALAVPDHAYTDLSPKGSVDAGLKDLIHELNTLDGLVTTSSCAGRISVFLEGQKDKPTKHGTTSAMTDEDPANGPESEKAVPGGKGMGGRWLFVSHDPVEVPSNVHELFGLVPQVRSSEGGKGDADADAAPKRLVRFQFEPMILHVLTASLAHASIVLSAALNAGFRESGVQSLKSLHDANAFPMVAVRTAGLGLSSVIGHVVDAAGGADDADGDQARSLVSEEYLAMMLRLGNERFGENEERIARFRGELRRAVEREVGGARKGDGKNGEWEDAEDRRERMRREGLARKREMQNEQKDASDAFEGNDVVDALEELDLGLPT